MKKFLILSALACVGAAQANLINNGDFESGLSHFTSDYTYDATNLYTEGYYTVNTDAHNVHGSWTSFGDHTTGTGHMLIANGNGNVNAKVWQGDSINLAPGKYTFSYYGASVYAGNPADLSVSLNNVTLGHSGTYSSNPGQWDLYSYTFTTAGGASSFALRDNNPDGGGNDFAVDDIKLQAVPEPTTMAALGFGALGLLKRRKRA